MRRRALAGLALALALIATAGCGRKRNEEGKEPAAPAAPAPAPAPAPVTPETPAQTGSAAGADPSAGSAAAPAGTTQTPGTAPGPTAGGANPKTTPGGATPGTNPGAAPGGTNPGAAPPGAGGSPKQAPPIGSLEDPAAGAAATGKIGQGCGAGDKCLEGSCVKYYGIAGPRGQEFKSCEIRCTKGTCPGGRSCVTIADGPGQVCR